MLKPTSPAITAYLQSLARYAAHHATHEGAVETAFSNLLAETAQKEAGWTLIPKQSMRVGGARIIPDGTLRDPYAIPLGYWEAKDTKDDLEAEIRAKIKKGYPLTNTIFEDTRTAVLFQNGARVSDFDLTQPTQIAGLLNTFFAYTEPPYERFRNAITAFAANVPHIAEGILERIADAHKRNRAFQAAFATFFELCRNALNPAITTAQVDELIVQHLLTERLIREIFNNPDFVRRNVIAREIETVIGALVSQSFSRDDFLKRLDPYFQAIEEIAAKFGDEQWSEKQNFLNEVYERFFQSYSTKIADTHGIVYTPQAIVDFMVASVMEVLQTEFGKQLGDPDVVILDPATGTGNFIVNLIRRAPIGMLETLYTERLFANEVMLLPYYIAALNIEHAYFERMGDYLPFEGLCFVDTLDMVQRGQMSMFSEANSARVQRQQDSPITVIIGNPPYNVGQANENDNNKNRRYDQQEFSVDNRIRATYAKDSKATNKNALSDVYVKFYRWATDRLEERDGVVCYVSNNGFIDQLAFDGMRKHLLQDFDRVFVFDLQGNIRRDSMRDGIPLGEKHTVFGLAAMVGITITILVRNKKRYDDHRLYYQTVDWRATRDEKFVVLEKYKSALQVDWTSLAPDNRHAWLVPENADEFETFVPIGSKEAKGGRAGAENTIFDLFSNGVKTNRDDVVYGFERKQSLDRVSDFIEAYNSEVDRYKRTKKPINVDEFVSYSMIKWSATLKTYLQRGIYSTYTDIKLRQSIYRPFTKKWLYFDSVLNERRYQFPYIFPTLESETENQVIWLKVGSEVPMFALMVNHIPDLLPQGGSQCFPFYTYDEDGTHRRENITDWALSHFQQHYADPTITKWDIFYYIYALLHHPAYRERFAANLKRELPRIPLLGRGTQDAETTTPGSPLSIVERGAGGVRFRTFVSAGTALAKLHLNYETAPRYPLERLHDPAHRPDYTVTKMRLNGDKSELIVNPTLTLRGIPPAAFRYKLGNRSALDWVIDQYQRKQEPRAHITSDPNDPAAPRAIVELVERVITVSVETMKIVDAFSEWREVENGNGRGKE